MSLVEKERRPRAERPLPADRLVEPVAPDRPIAPPADAKARSRRPLLKGVIAVLVVAVIAGATLWWLSARNWESTDDAFIDVHTVQVSPQVAGRVLRVLVDDNQEVHAGQPLVEIDPADFKARLDQAVANQQSAAGLSQSRQIVIVFILAIVLVLHRGLVCGKDDRRATV